MRLRRDSDFAPVLEFHFPVVLRLPSRAAPQETLSAPLQTRAPQRPRNSRDETRAYKPDADAAAVAGETKTARRPQCWEWPGLPAQTHGTPQPDTRRELSTGPPSSRLGARCGSAANDRVLPHCDNESASSCLFAGRPNRRGRARPEMTNRTPRKCERGQLLSNRSKA